MCLETKVEVTSYPAQPLGGKPDGRKALASLLHFIAFYVCYRNSKLWGSIRTRRTTVVDRFVLNRNAVCLILKIAYGETRSRLPRL
jgi:hypothetical protein